MKRKFKKGFTLGEVLMVIALMGVVAALTVPNIASDMEERSSIASLRKAASDLQNSYTSMESTIGDPQSLIVSNMTSENATRAFINKYKTFLQVDTDCEFSTGCFSSSYNSNTAYYKFILKNGSAIALKMNAGSTNACSDKDKKYYPCTYGHLYVDVDGPKKGYNQLGYDIFRFTISKNGVEPDGLSETEGVTPSGKTAWAIKAGNRDYLTCSSNLSWKSKRSCK